MCLPNFFSNIKALLIDLDGTIVNSLPDRITAINYMLKTLSFPAIDPEKIQYFIGDGVFVLATKTLMESLSTTQESFSKALIQQAVDLYEAYYLDHICEKTYSYPHVIETLATLYQHNIALALVTNKRSIHSQKLMAQLKIDRYFKVIVGGDMAQKKPNPDLLNLALEKLNISHKYAAMVGDSIDDVMAAKRAHIPIIGVSYGYKPLTNKDTTMLIEDFSALTVLIKHSS